MALFTPTQRQDGAARTHPLDARTLALVGAASLVAVLLGLFVPDRTVGAGDGGMPMTHYMGLLAVAQPWNLLIFMAIPVILAETLAITELALLFGGAPAWVRRLSRVAGLIVGPVMLGIGVHLLRYAVLPLTLGGGWRGVADVVAVLAYLAGALPMIGITLVEVGLLGSDERARRKLHAIFVGVFLVVAHVAMIFGMLDPGVLGWHEAPATPGHQMPDGSMMPGMKH